MVCERVELVRVENLSSITLNIHRHLRRQWTCDSLKIQGRKVLTLGSKLLTTWFLAVEPH